MTLLAENAGDAPAPFGAGFHPISRGGHRMWRHAVTQVPADAWLPADERGIPTGEHRPVDGEVDLRAPRAIGDSVLDYCFPASTATGRAARR